MEAKLSIVWTPTSMKFNFILEHLRTIDGVNKDSLYIHLCKCVMEGMHIHVWGCLKNLAEGIGSPRAEVVGSCEPPNMGSEN